MPSAPELACQTRGEEALTPPPHTHTTHVSGCTTFRRRRDETERFALLWCDVLLLPSSIAALQLLQCRVDAAPLLHRSPADSANALQAAGLPRSTAVPLAYLAAFPSIECWSAQHWRASLCGLVFGFLNLVAFPAYVVYQLAFAYLRGKSWQALF
jgi:hypothetical protein